MLRQISKTFQLAALPWTKRGEFLNRELGINLSEFRADMLDWRSNKWSNSPPRPASSWRQYLLCYQYSAAADSAQGTEWQVFRTIPTLEFLRYDGGIYTVGLDGRTKLNDGTGLSGAKAVGYNPWLLIERSAASKEEGILIDNVQDAIDALAGKLMSLGGGMRNIMDIDRDAINNAILCGTVSTAAWRSPGRQECTSTFHDPWLPRNSAIFGAEHDIYKGENLLVSGKGHVIPEGSSVSNAAILGGSGLTPVASNFAVADRLAINSRLLLLGDGSGSPPDESDVLMVESLEIISDTASGEPMAVPKVKWSGALTEETARATARENEIEGKAQGISIADNQNGSLTFTSYEGEESIIPTGKKVQSSDGTVKVTENANDFDLSIQSEIDSRKAADSSLQSGIDSETARAQEAEQGLQARIDSEILARASADADLQQQIDAFAGALIYIGTIDLATSDVTQAALDSQAQALGKYPPQLGYVLIDSDANDWWHNGSEWVNIGYYEIAQATNTQLGVVKGSTDSMKVSVDSAGEMSVNGLQNALDSKQGALTAGINIQISGNTISASGGNIWSGSNTGGDADAVTEPGLYSGSWTSNQPPGASWGSLFVMPSDVGTQYRQKIFIRESSNRMWFKSNGKDWAELGVGGRNCDTVHCITDTDGSLPAYWKLGNVALNKLGTDISSADIVSIEAVFGNENSWNESSSLNKEIYDLIFYNGLWRDYRKTSVYIGSDITSNGRCLWKLCFTNSGDIWAGINAPRFSWVQGIFTVKHPCFERAAQRPPAVSNPPAFNYIIML